MYGKIEADGLKHSFQMGKLTVPVLHGIDLTVEPGEFVALCGASGSGKSTLLNLIGGLMQPTDGTIRVDGQTITGLSENKLCLFRRDNIGFIFQSYNLMPYLTALENVELPLVFSRVAQDKRREMAIEALEQVGLADRMDHRPGELSGGQQQRASIARSLVTKPRVILADEPTGNLDSQTGSEIMMLLKELNRENASTFLIVTHDLRLAEICGRTVYLKDGQIVDEQEVAQ